MSKAGVSDSLQSVRVAAPDQAHKLCYVIEGMLVADFRLTLG